MEKIEVHILCSVLFFFENRPVYEIMWKNVVVADRPLMKIWRMRIAFFILQVYKHTFRICNTYCFSTATVFARTRLNLTFIRTLPVIFEYWEKGLE